MRCLRLLLLSLLLLAAAAFAQTEHKPKPEDYDVHAHATVLGKPVEVGAEFVVHSFSAGEESYVAPDFLVVDVALYPAKGDTLQVSLSQFLLRVNGKKQPLMAQPAQLVASSLRYPEWQNRPHVEAGGGMGGMGVGIGQPRPTNIPGYPPQPGTTTRPPIDVPKDNPGGLDPRQRAKPEDLVVRTALPAGEFQKPISGFLYFSYKGKVASIKSLELLYEDSVVKLR